MRRRICVQETVFDVAEETREIREASHKVGGIATFLGVVRDINEDAEVANLYLEHYPGMTESQINKIIDGAADRWQIHAVTVIHRIGHLLPNDEIVFVGVGSEHRGDAFAVCEYVMDYLKTQATFWKKEQTGTTSRWLSTRQTDVEAAGRWSSDETEEV
ncbi:MAG TPA: molybdenum cofactor biosynthesis protein MoaE [Gammaproteobacteria bacterium]|nr:molybdenum cofactor biosynthesis protein MoaE [Gammaproteobacteria bacterium]